MRTFVDLLWLSSMMGLMVAFVGLFFGGMVKILPAYVAGPMFVGGMGWGMFSIILCVICFGFEMISRS